MVTERPIIFSGPMVQAILDGRKTQTRRIVKPKDSWLCAPEPQVQHEVRPGLLETGEWGWVFDGCVYGIIGRCPYGVPGDLLYVREKFVMENCREVGYYAPPFDDGRPIKQHHDSDWGEWWEQPHYAATDPEPELAYDDCDEPRCRWRPSIHMPKWAARIWLEITDVRVQRVQDITNDDAIAEGCQGGPGIEGYSERNPADPYEEFALLWDGINAKRGYGWDTNPWCWCLTFRVTQRAGR